MKTRPCGGGFATAIPDWENPCVVMSAPTVVDAEHQAGLAHMRMMEREEEEQARLRQYFSAQQHAEYLKIRARA